MALTMIRNNAKMFIRDSRGVPQLYTFGKLYSTSNFYTACSIYRYGNRLGLKCMEEFAEYLTREHGTDEIHGGVF